MAKISLNKLNIKKNDVEANIININGVDVEVKQYLPVNEKLDLISWIINQSADDMKFYNVGKLIIFKTIGLLRYYTNINFTDKQLENAAELFDLIYTSGLSSDIIGAIPTKEIEFIDKVLMDTVDSIYKYQNSIFGILNAVTTDYENLNFDVSELQKNISNPENLTLLKDVVTKLG